MDEFGRWTDGRNSVRRGLVYTKQKWKKRTVSFQHRCLFVQTHFVWGILRILLSWALPIYLSGLDQQKLVCSRNASVLDVSGHTLKIIGITIWPRHQHFSIVPWSKISKIFSHSLFLTISAKVILINDLILMNPVCIQTDIKIFMVFDSLTRQIPLRS